jgi:hypothetical protein
VKSRTAVFRDRDGVLDRSKPSPIGKDLDECSPETVRMFRQDAVSAGDEIAGARVTPSVAMAR